MAIVAERLFATFERIYVINLANRADRRTDMAGELARLGTGFNDPRVRLFEAIRPVDAGSFRSIGARGCFLSQLEVLREAQRDGCRRILMFEDDVDFVPGIAKRLPAILDTLDMRGFGIFYGGYELPDGEGHVWPISGPLISVSPDRAVRLAHFVGFDRSAIDLLVPYLELMIARSAGSASGGPMDVDGAYCWFRAAHPDLVTWLAQPQLGHQRPSRTDISPPGPLDRLPMPEILRRHIRAVRRFWRRRNGAGARSAF
jgi:glycosyl transferase family 25